MEIRMRESDEKCFAFEYEFSFNQQYFREGQVPSYSEHLIKNSNIGKIFWKGLIQLCKTVKQFPSFIP